MNNSQENRCPTCFEYYESENRVPKVLKCGHTFCIPCLFKFLDFIKSCPKCSTPIEVVTTELPTNQALYNQESTNKDPLEELELKKKSLINLAEKQKEHVTENLQILSQSYDKLKTSNEKLKLWNFKKASDDREFDKNLREIEEILGKLQLQLYSCYKPDINPFITLSKFPTKEEFIFKVVIEVFKGKNVYAFHSEWYNKKIYWGKMSYTRGKLYIHAFTPDLPQYPYTFVPFRDLKKCMTEENFQTFIDIAGDHLTCTMLTSSIQTKIFVKLCSGEEEISLKGLKCRIKMFSLLKHGVLEVENAGKKNIIDDDYEFLGSLPSETNETFDDDLLQIRMRNEKFEIVKCPNLKSTDALPDDIIVGFAKSNGRVFSTLLDIETCVDDSGIILTLPSGESTMKKNRGPSTP